MKSAKSILSVALAAAAISISPLCSEASALAQYRGRSYSPRTGSYRYGSSYRFYRPYTRFHYRPFYNPLAPYYYGGFYGGYYGGFYPGYYGGQWGYSYYSGSVQTKVKPVETQVYVDGYYAGAVDDFDGIFQRLYLTPGEHEIEFQLSGYRTYSQTVLVNAGQNYKIHHDMVPLGLGETNPPPPEIRQPEERQPFQTSPPPQSESQGEAMRAPPPSRPEEPIREAPSRPQVSSAHFGMLSLHVQPADAEVVIDGERWGTLEGLESLVIHLPAGPHHVEIRREGHEAFVTDVDIRENETTPLNVRLSRDL